MLNHSMSISSRPLFRVIVPRFAKHNIFSGVAKNTISLSAIMIATVANKLLPWLDVEVIDENNYRKSMRGPRDGGGNPDHGALQRERTATFIGLCCSMTNAMPRALEIVKFYKSDFRVRGIIAGGWHVLYEPTEILQAGADVVVHGEGETVIADILMAMNEGKPIFEIPGISFWRDGVICRNEPEQLLVEDLNCLPYPDFSLARYAKIKTFPISRIRGCSGRCKFCSVKGRPRFISPERFLGHVQHLISQGARDFFLVDDRVEEDRVGSLRFFSCLGDYCRERHVRIDITVQIRLAAAEDTELLSAMRRAGVSLVCIGYESPIRAELQAMRKPISLNPEKMLEWTRTFKRFGFFIHAMFVLGYPLEPEQRKEFEMSARERAKHFWQFIKRASRAGVDTIQILLLTPLLGTEVRERLKKEGRLYNIEWEFYDGTWLLFDPDQGVEPRKLQMELMRLMRKFYAFNYLWPSKIVSLIAHFVRIGIITVSMPIEYSLSGFRPWYNKWRNSLVYLGAHLIIWKWLNNFKRINFFSKIEKQK